MPLPKPLRTMALSLTGVAALAGAWAAERGPSMTGARWKQHDPNRPRPPVVAPADAPIAVRPPADAVVLFDGTNLDAWQTPDGGKPGWRVADGVLETVPGTGLIRTRAEFGDVQLHVEWAAPDPPVGQGQGRGNSGVFLMGQFEIQVLDSYQANTYADGQAGALYGQYPPLANASRPPGQWQSYDIAFRRPRFDAAGALTEPARITVFHNGILIQNNEEAFGPTSWIKWKPYAGLPSRGPLALQDHDHPVRYRNLWIRDLPERPAPSAADLAAPKLVTLAPEALDRFAGRYRSANRADGPATVVTREGDHLALKFPTRDDLVPIVPISATTFVSPVTASSFDFRSDPTGRVTGVRYRIGDGDGEWVRVAD